MVIARVPPNQQDIRDNEHLKLLSIFHYIFGGFHIVFSSLAIFHFIFGLLIIFKAQFLGELPRGQPPVFFGYLLTVFAGIIILFGSALGTLTIYSGFCIKGRKHRRFSLIVAGINCILIPFGTTLGVFTIIVLSRDSVRTLYKMKQSQ